MRPENADFAALLKLSGWTQIEAARRFDVEQPTVSRWVNDKDPAPRAVVDLFKFILAHEKPEAIQPGSLRDEELAAWETKLLNDLRWLRPNDREQVLAVIRTMVSGMPKEKIEISSTANRLPAPAEVPVDYVKRRLRKKLPPA